MQFSRDNPSRPRSSPYGPLGAIVFLALLLSACSGPAPQADRADPQDLRGLRRTESATGRPPDQAPPAALVGGQPVTWDALRPALAEAAGAVVLEEAVLDRVIADEYRARFGPSADPPPSLVAAERVYFIDAIRRTADAAPDQAEILARTLRRNRGLGDVRFSALLKRNAMLRRMVAHDVTISPDMIAQRFEVRFGPRFRARIITAPTDAQAAAALRELAAGEGDLGPRFAALAARISTDESRTRGGQIEPISPADPAYSPALRSALAALKPGEMTGIIDLDPGFGIAYLEEVLPPAAGATLEENRADIEEELRRRQERVLMDSLARRLLREARVSVLDPSLAWSWRNREGGEP